MKLRNPNLAARFIGLMLLALIVSQALTLSIFWDERAGALREVAKSDFLSRTSSLASLLDRMPVDERQMTLQVSSTAYERFWLFPASPSQPSEWWKFARRHLLEPLSHGKPQGTLSIQFRSEDEVPPATIDATAAWSVPGEALWPSPRTARFIYLPQLNVMGVATPLKNGTWLHAAYAKPVTDSPFSRRALVSLGITALALTLIAVLIARGISQPLRDLALAAQRLGRGHSGTELREHGPEDIRRTAKAFNQMQRRIQRFVDDRTRMLAAVGHDLRTPLTSLRLRIEFIQDPEVQRKMLATLDEITAITEAAIGYGRDNAVTEPTRTMDIGTLVESLCEDLVTLGMAVSFSCNSKVILECRPDALRRAIRNLIENAVRYGECADVRVYSADKHVHISVTDRGNGIPDSELEAVFTPFYRLEHSRNRNTGGVGLGLSIVRSIARQHGGEITLTNHNGGLEAIISLPEN
ncbi:ATP-binding protein [Pseudomonas putida]|uniref:sensor histidine kinase n=1 Tax=Pseudomonas putida TaxID=303 RepID=UPI000313824B|nr:ATP-binding protein [Pseudomonas putida]MDD1996727.1 ATP-binding protein [Pseudomonas putida]HDS1787363.1 HAMP domain-containing protein [Pseudomonas putida]